MHCAAHSAAAPVAQVARSGARPAAKRQQGIAAGLPQPNHCYPLAWDSAAGVNDRYLGLPTSHLAVSDQAGQQPAERGIELGGRATERHSLGDPDDHGIALVANCGARSELQLHTRYLPPGARRPLADAPAVRPAGGSRWFGL